MIIFIIIMFIVFFIGKFIYDSYLTDNTEKKWAEHQRNELYNKVRLKSKLEYDKKEAEKKRIITYLNEFFKEELENLKINSSDVGASFEINLGIDILKDEMKENKHKVELTINEIEKLFEDYRIECSKLYSDKSLLEETIDISRTEARNIILGRHTLENGLNRNIKVVDVEFDENNNEAEVFFDAMDSNTKKLATEFFKKGEYNKAIEVYPSKKVCLELGKKLEDCKLANISCITKRAIILIEECIPINNIANNVGNKEIKLHTENYYRSDIKIEDGRIVSYVIFILNEKYAFIANQEEFKDLGIEFNHKNILKLKSGFKARVPQIKEDEVSYLDENLGKYEIVDNNFRFIVFNLKNKYNTDIKKPNVYLEFYGQINNDKLVLNIWSNSYNYYYPENSDDKFRRVLEHINIKFDIVND